MTDTVVEKTKNQYASTEALRALNDLFENAKKAKLTFDEHVKSNEAYKYIAGFIETNETEYKK